MRVFAYVFAWWTAIGQLRAALSPISVLGDIQETHMQNLPFLFSLFATGELCCGFELLVLVGSSWCVPRWRVSSVFPNYWCHEACTRDGNNVRFLGSATAWPLEAIWLRSALHHHLFMRMERWSVKVMEFIMRMRPGQRAHPVRPIRASNQTFVCVSHTNLCHLPTVQSYVVQNSTRLHAMESFLGFML